MKVFVRFSTLLVWLIFCLGWLPDSIRLGRSFDAFFSGTVLCLPLIVSSVVLYRGLKRATTIKHILVIPSAFGSIFVWLPSLIMVGGFGIFTLIHVLIPWSPLQEAAMIYIIMFPVYGCSLVLAVIAALISDYLSS